MEIIIQSLVGKKLVVHARFSIRPTEGNQPLPSPALVDELRSEVGKMADVRRKRFDAIAITSNKQLAPGETESSVLKQRVERRLRHIGYLITDNTG